MNLRAAIANRLRGPAVNALAGLLGSPRTRQLLLSKRARLLRRWPFGAALSLALWKQAYAELVANNAAGLKECLGTLTGLPHEPQAHLFKHLLSHVRPSDTAMADVLREAIFAALISRPSDIRFLSVAADACRVSGDAPPPWLAIQARLAMGWQGQLIELPVVAIGAENSLARVNVLAEATPYEQRLPVVITTGVHDQGTRSGISPAIRIAQIDNASIFGSGLVVSNQEPVAIVHHESGHCLTDPLTAGHRHYVEGTFEDGLAVIQRVPMVRTTVKSGVLLGARASTNYFHWLIEYLPRLMLLDDIGVSSADVLLTRLPLYIQQTQSLSAVLPQARLVAWKDGTALDVQHLTLIDGPAHVEDDPRTPSDEIFQCRPALISRMAERILDNLDLAHVSGGRKIYLARSGRRDLLNAGEVIEELSRNGFEVVSAEQMNFVDQVRLFRESAVIAGPSGAAFSNLLFCRPGTGALIFNAPRHSRNNVFSQIADVAGARVAQVIGIAGEQKISEIVPSIEDLIHQDYAIPLARVRSALSWAAAQNRDAPASLHQTVQRH